MVVVIGMTHIGVITRKAIGTVTGGIGPIAITNARQQDTPHPLLAVVTFDIEAPHEALVFVLVAELAFEADHAYNPAAHVGADHQ